MKAIVKEGCISCGLCVGICAEVFQMGDDGFSHAVGEVTAQNKDAVQEAADSCPVQVIEVQ